MVGGGGGGGLPCLVNIRSLCKIVAREEGNN